MPKYVYPAIFLKEEVGYSVRFPDIAGCNTQGETLSDAIEKAEDALNLILYTFEEEGLPINPPSDIRTLTLEQNEISSLVACDTLEYRKFFDNKAVKKTLTIPSWLNTMSERANVNFSSVLQEALMNKLNI